MKVRSRTNVGEASANRVKTETLSANGSASGQQTSAQVIRKRRSSINVYDQPSSLNARLRQLETDMLRLDEDRTKLFDDTHSALAQYEIRLSEIQSILKSRQDNVDKYVEEMKLLLIAKDEFERQTKNLNEKYERIQDKFTHRETTVSRDIKILKTKFEMLEKNRQFRNILNNSTPKSSDINTSSINNNADTGLSTVDESGADSVHQSEGRRNSGHSSDQAKSVETSLVGPETSVGNSFGSSIKRLGRNVLNFFSFLLKPIRSFRKPSLSCSVSTSNRYKMGTKKNRIAAFDKPALVEEQANKVEQINFGDLESKQTKDTDKLSEQQEQSQQQDLSSNI